MKFLVFILSFLSFASYAQIKTTFSGNLEAQGRFVENTDEAKDELMQDWDKDEFYLYQANLNLKFDFKNSKIETNHLIRHGRSDLLKNENNLAPNIYMFPRKMVAREIFKFYHTDEGSKSQTDYILTQAYYQWDYENRFAIGRLNINYGQGEIFNPINPFNQPTGLTSLNQVSQGSDGANFTFFVDDKHTLSFYFLGDKTQDGYDGQIQHTIWMHGEYEVTDKFQFDYVLGNDRNRHKAGTQLKYNLENASTFLQVLYQTDYTDDKSSHPLWDAMLGYDQQLTSKWHLRFEGGYQKKNRYLLDDEISDRFLPAEYFVGLANQYEIHPLVKINGTIFTDIKDGFTYFVNKNTISISNNVEADIFASIPVVRPSTDETIAQKIITTDFGVSLRAFF